MATNNWQKVHQYDFQGSRDEIINQVRDSTGGFTIVIAGLKAWLEHNIQLNLVEDKFPKRIDERITLAT